MARVEKACGRRAVVVVVVPAVEVEMAMVVNNGSIVRAK